MESRSRNNKIIVILGPTSSGKSDIAIKLAKNFDGEIISADSRQIYRGMDIGTGKITKQEQRLAKHWMIDIISPRTNFSAARFKKKADKIIADILKRGKLPIICGGTGFWIKALVDDVAYPEVKPDPVLRSMLRNKSTDELFLELQKLDPERAKTIDAKNPVRLIRAIEICKAIGKVPSPDYGRDGHSHPSLPYSGEMSRRTRRDREGSEQNYEFLQIGISLPKEKLHENIRKRLKQRFKSGMIEEVERLHYKDKVSWKRLEGFGLGYGLIPKFIRGEIATKEALFEKVFKTEKDYAKRQMTWFKKDQRIHWMKNYTEAEKATLGFLKR